MIAAAVDDDPGGEFTGVWLTAGQRDDALCDGELVLNIFNCGCYRRV
jgi:hypothetical protein